MSYRTTPRTIPELLVWIERRLRRNERNQVTTAITTDHGNLAGLSDDDHGQYQARDEQGVADGYPSLDGTGVVPKAQLPSDVVYDADLPDSEEAEVLAWLALTEG